MMVDTINQNTHYVILSAITDSALPDYNHGVLQLPIGQNKLNLYYSQVVECSVFENKKIKKLRAIYKPIHTFTNSPE